MTLAYLWVISEPGSEVTVEEFNGKFNYFLKLDRKDSDLIISLYRLVR